MSDQTDRYLAKAAECERKAAYVTGDEIQSTFLDLADHWRDIARDVEHLAMLRRGLRMSAMWLDRSRSEVGKKNSRTDGATVPG